MPLVTPRIAPVALLITSADFRADADAIRTRRRDAAGVVDRREGKNADASCPTGDGAGNRIVHGSGAALDADTGRACEDLAGVVHGHRAGGSNSQTSPAMVPVLLVTLMLPPVGPKLAMPKLPPEIVPAFTTFARVVKSMPTDPPEMVPVLLVTLTVEAKIPPPFDSYPQWCPRYSRWRWWRQGCQSRRPRWRRCPC